MEPLYCSICIDDIQLSGDKTTTGCNHHFHKNCLEGWLNQIRDSSENGPFTCPLCRFDITDEQPKFFYWDNSRKLKMFRNKEIEVRYYPNHAIKYRIYVDVNDKVYSGTVFDSDGTTQLNASELDSGTIHQLRTDDYFNVSF